MCWSGEASAVIAGIGFATTGYAVYKKDPPAIWIPLTYFSLMELLQAYTYTVIDDCSHVGNQLATILGYIHIAFQPFFGNLMSLYFVPEKVRKRWSVAAYATCFIAAVIMLLQLYPYQGLERCSEGTFMNVCGSLLCSFSGNWHIAWSVPYVSFDIFSVPINGIFYGIAMFFLPLLYGSWKFTLYHLLMGPLLSALTTNSPNERAAVWCLLSIGFLLIVIKTPLRNWLHVKRWFLWGDRG